jgi:hypothetical protein
MAIAEFKTLLIDVLPVQPVIGTIEAPHFRKPGHGRDVLGVRAVTTLQSS